MTKLPQVRGDRLVKALIKLGWFVDRTRGSHVVMRNDREPKAMIVVPVHSNCIKSGTLSNILKKAGISGDEIRRLL